LNPHMHCDDRRAQHAELAGVDVLRVCGASRAASTA
jgi:hypothetical protein